MYEQSVVGRRVSIQFRDDPGEPFYDGVVAEWDNCSLHCIRYDDGEQRQHNLAEEEEEGQLRWLDGPNAYVPVPQPKKPAAPRPPPKQPRSAATKRLATESPTPSSSSSATTRPPALPRPTRPYQDEVKDRRVSIYWTGDRKWFTGTIVQFDATTDEHYIKYEDGDQMWEALAEMEDRSQLRWLDANGAKMAERPAPDDENPRRAKKAKTNVSAGLITLAHGEKRSEEEEAAWRDEGHEWIGRSVRRLEYLPDTARAGQLRSGLTYVDGVITKWVPAGEEEGEPALWRMQHADGDEEDLEEFEASEALLAYDRNHYSVTFHELIKEYVDAGVRILQPDGKTVKIEKEALPCNMSAEKYFEGIDLYVGNFYGHNNTIMDLARAHAPHKTTCCREPMVVVLPRSEQPRALLRQTGFRDCKNPTRKVGWPKEHPSWRSVQSSGEVNQHYVCSRAVLLAALRWPTWYEFIESTEDDSELDNYNLIERQNQGVVTHMLGEAVMPELARVVMHAANASSAGVTSLFDLFCCGGGFSLGASEALPDLEYVDGVDKDRIVLRNYAHNVPKAFAKAKVEAHERAAPISLKELRSLAQGKGRKKLGVGTHVHLSPPCQRFVNSKPSERRQAMREMAPYLQLMVDGVREGMTCSLEEHKDVRNVALDWLAEQDEATRSLLFVYSVTARDYGSPTTRERCVVTSFALEGEEDVNPAHV